jgi:protein TonB
MATTIGRKHALSWLRVGAWSGSFAAHFAALLLLALPMTAPSLRPHVEPVIARWIAVQPPPLPLPEPPPPVAPHRVRPVQSRHPPADSSPVISDVTEAAAPIPDVSEVQAPAEVAPPPSSDDVGSGGGKTQALSYATPLRPKYPAASARAQEEGLVLLRVLVDAAGVPERVEIAKSSGHARLDRAARDSVRSARFHPVLRNGEAIPAWGLVPIEFRLDHG